MSSLSKSLFSMASLTALILLAVGAQAASTWHVPGDYATIQAAINAASAGDTIQIAAGIYAESLTWTSKDLTLQGAGAGQSIIDPSATSGGPGGRCLYTASLSSASHIDGFTLQNGNSYNGGGMYNDSSSSPTVTNCIFSGNSAVNHGGGMGNAYASSPTVTNCIFSGNHAANAGGGIANDYLNTTTVTNCTFSSNSGYAGGGIYNGYFSSPTEVNCTFSCNSGSIGGGIFNDYSSNPTVTNCILWGNSAKYYGDGMGGNYISSPMLTYSDDQDSSNTAPDANGNFGADPQFVRNPFTNGPDDYGDLHLQAGSPCINVGNNVVVASPPFLTNTSGVIIDLDGNPRISGGMVDLGAYELQNLAPIANAGSNQTVPAIHTGNPATDYASVTLDGSGSYDPDGDPITYAWDDGKGHTSTAVQPTFNLAVGTYTFTLTVTDPYSASSQANVTIIVAPAPNSPPVLSVQSSAAVDVGCPVTFQASATDPDEDTLTYCLANLPSWASINSSTGVVTLAPPAGTSGSFTLTVQATDPYGASDHKNVSVTVCPILISGVTLSRKNNIVTVQFNVSNTDGTLVTNVSLNSATLKGVATITALPIVYAQLKQGVVKTVQLKFQNVSPGMAQQLIINGTSSAGPVCANMSVNVP